MIRKGLNDATLVSTPVFVVFGQVLVSLAAILALFDAVVATWSSQVHSQAHVVNFVPPLGPPFWSYFGYDRIGYNVPTWWILSEYIILFGAIGIELKKKYAAPI